MEFSLSSNSDYAIRTIKSRAEFSLSSNSDYATGSIKSGQEEDRLNSALLLIVPIQGS